MNGTAAAAAAPPTHRRLLAAAVLLLVLAGLVPFLRKRTSELPVYLRAAERMMQGLEIYRPDEPKPFTYPPFFALPFVPLALLPAPARRPVWYFVNVGLLAWVVVTLHRLVRRGWAGARSGPGPAFWLAVALLAGRHVSAVFENQSHDLVTLALLTAVALAGSARRDAPAGAAAGIGAACKATPLLFLPAFVAQRRWRAALALLAAAATATFLPDLVAPRADGRLWLEAWTATFVAPLDPAAPAARSGAWNAWNYLNQSLSGTIHRLTTPIARPEPHVFDVSLIALEPGARKLLTLGLEALLVGLLLFVLPPRRKPRDGVDPLRPLGEAAAVGAAMLLLSPMSSKSHFCVLLLAAVHLTAGLARRRDPVVVALLALAFGAGTLTVKGLLGAALGNRVLAYGSVTLCALAFFLAEAHVLHRSGAALRR